MEMEEEDEDEEDEDNPGSGWLGVEPVPAAASHHAIFQISAIQLKAEHSSVKSSAEMNCDSLCALEYLRIKQKDDNEQLRRDEEGEAAESLMENSASWHNLNYYGFKQSFATRGDEAEYLKNHLMIFRSRDKFVRRHLTCTLSRECLQQGSNLYDRSINVSMATYSVVFVNALFFYRFVPLYCYWIDLICFFFSVLIYQFFASSFAIYCVCWCCFILCVCTNNFFSYQINVPEVYLEVDPEILHRLEGFLTIFNRVSRESMDRVQGVMVDVEEDEHQEENDRQMTESGDYDDEEEQLSGKLHFTLGGGFLCVKLRFAGRTYCAETNKKKRCDSF